MNSSTTTTASTSSSCCGTGQGSGSWITGRTGILVSAVVLGGAALWLGWPWLVVAGIAPILIALLPCLIMCGAMCAAGMCSKKQPAAKGADASLASEPAGPLADARPMVGAGPSRAVADAASTNSSCCGGGQGSGSWLTSRAGILVSAGVLGGAALWLGWPWLVVAGIAPILIALLPCLIMCGAMCAAGMCFKKQPAAKGADASPGTAPAGALADAPSNVVAHPRLTNVADESTTPAALTWVEPSASPRSEIGPSPVPGSAAETRMPA